MSDTCNIPHPLKREGTNQQQRFPKALNKDDADFVKLDEKSLTDLVKQSAEFARLIRYYNETNPNTPDGSWVEFFEEIYDFNAQKVKFSDIVALNEIGNSSPHIALFLSFLQLYRYPQKEINEMTNRHLDFYYKDILKIKELKEVADKVVVFFELDKNFVQQRIPKDTYLRAGKDATGKELFFKTVDDLIVNQGKVEEIKTIFTEGGPNVTGVFAAPVANSGDGKGAEIRTVPPGWPAFGNTAQPAAEIGFAIASPILNLKTGLRTIEIQKTGIGGIPDNSIRVSYTSEKGWIECRLDQVSASAYPNKIVVTLQVNDPPFTAYLEKLHKRNFVTDHPVLMINLVQATGVPYQFAHFGNLSLASLNIHIKVDKLKNLVLYNDQGVLDNSKPFLPFGNFPKAGSNFYIGGPDIFNKYFQKFSIKSETSAPVLFFPVTDYVLSFSNTAPAAVRVYFLKENRWEIENDGGASDQFSLPFNNEYSSTKVLNTSTTDGFIKFVLSDERFSLDQYESELLKYVTKSPDAPPAPPLKPISPQLENINLYYESQALISLSETNKEHQFFKIYPFGYYEETITTNRLIDDWSFYNARLFIGIRNLPQYASISINFQMHEGTGDPDLEPVSVNWYCVSGNTYISLQRQIIKDTTNGFTQSGVIQFALPDQLIEPNTILNPELIWLRAVIVSNAGVFPKMTAITSQAAEAIFDNRNNDPKRLAIPLSPGSVTKLSEKIDGIKSVTQFFPSYNGKMKEDQQDPAFRTRISERLRHKQRSWNIWDYERMLLQQFAYVDKIKCISHSTTLTEFAPGNILIVALPIVSEINQDDIYEPRLSIGRLQEMKKFLKRYHSAFANINIINPTYERLRVTATVKFLVQGDDPFNSNRLSEDLKVFFAPWAQSSKKEIFFRSKIYVAEVMNFIEQREYVDFVTHLELVKYIPGGNYQACPEIAESSNEHAILTTDLNHVITGTDHC